jgi:hypothetical protein
MWQPAQEQVLSSAQQLVWQVVWKLALTQAQQVLASLSVSVPAASLGRCLMPIRHDR